jgi:hypothetical protein
MDLVNQSGTPKLWPIAYENGHKNANTTIFLASLSKMY